MPNAPVIPGTLPGGAGYCPNPATYQQVLIDMAATMQVPLPALAFGIWRGDSQPADRATYPLWARTNGGTQVYPPLWQYETGPGLWLARHPILPLSSFCGLWIGTEAALVTYDGGDNQPVGDTTGPMWAIEHAMDARFPVGPGTLPSGVSIAVTGTTDSGGGTGEEKHQLTVAELAAHSHIYAIANGNTAPTGGASEPWPPPNVGANIATNPEGGDVAHNNMPPYYGVFLIRRTARIYYTQPI